MGPPNIDLPRLEARPPRSGLGDSCSRLDCHGHSGDDGVADCLRELKMKQGDIKFLGSYPAAGHDGDQVRRDSNANWLDAADWVEELRGQISQ